MDKNLEQKIDEILTRGVAEVIDKENLKKRLLSCEKLRIKFGIDPTSPDIHLGRAVALMKLRDFQEIDCEIEFIIGDFTGQIGDTSDKDSERPMLSEDLVKKNMENYLYQAYKILDKNKIKIFYNSWWLSGLTLNKVGSMATWFSLAEFISRENIKSRLQNGKRISLREVLYPLMQGYDSVRVVADVEIGGSDQRFNMLAGRELQRHPMDILAKSDFEEIYKDTLISTVKIMDKKNNPQDILMVNLIEGTDGRKMSSSWGNTINLTDEPNDMLGKIMSMPDNLITKYFIHCTRVSMEKVNQTEKDMQTGKMNPRDAKLELAQEIVKIYHGEEAAKKAQEYFVNTFSKRETPEDIAEIKVDKSSINIVDFMVMSGNAKSKGDARRKIEQGGVSIDGEKVSTAELMLDAENHDGKVIKVGKIHFVRIKFQ